MGLSMIVSLFIKSTDLSLHGYYKNGLVRTFLGMPHGIRREADIPMHQLQRQPFHVVNMACVLYEGSVTKVRPFTSTPLSTGCPDVGYVSSQDYAGGITLGTAMAISGAAVSPNLGPRTSWYMTLLKSLLNARLGVWLPNPSYPNLIHRRNPLTALYPLFQEMLGQLNGRYIYTTDGGHFENLALYEMVLRGCKRIMVVDSGCDPDYFFDDLANAILKIRSDLGIRIDIDISDTRNRAYIGYIRYSDDPSEDGVLVLIKPIINGNEPIEIKNYAARNSTFPQESTADQWFSEAQFESYRLLGSYTIDELFRSGNSPHWEEAAKQYVSKGQDVAKQHAQSH